jgi:energy-coupling factor transporter transmembrane protein EcfT
VHQAMQCRGFKGKFHSLQEFHVNSASWIFAILMTVVIVWLGLMEWFSPN